MSQQFGERQRPYEGLPYPEDPSLPGVGHAQITMDMSRLTCANYSAMSPGQARIFSAWMSGWFSYQLSKETIDLLTHEKNIANVKAWCQYHPQDTVMSGLKNATGQ